MSATALTPAASPPTAPVLVPRRHVGRWITGAVALLLVGLLLFSLAQNPRMQWDVVARNLTAPSILSGVLVTLELTAIAAVVGFAGGVALAIMRLSGNPVLAAISWGFTWIFRSVPTLVQLFFWFNIAALYPTVSLGLPGFGTFWSAQTNSLIGTFGAALIALILHEAAYAGEIVRAGMIGVGQGQTDAARALGFTPLRTTWRIILPQAMRTMLPPAGNQIISLLKTTSVVSVIALENVLYSAQVIYERTYEVIPLLVVAALWYIVMTSVLSVLQQYVERRFDRGARAGR
ncbi:amino acid ABC transporter permease [Roseomonas gilardii]|uniref:amino acid ABC transporter permease n=1 Tax=Roseomonas gilardii TaxID=257708 RepID=UPI0004B7A41C|nr:amino acid ABC transporter permease [Roseomonas gilardii]